MTLQGRSRACLAGAPSWPCWGWPPVCWSDSSVGGWRRRARSEGTRVCSWAMDAWACTCPIFINLWRSRAPWIDFKVVLVPTVGPSVRGWWRLRVRCDAAWCLSVGAGRMERMRVVTGPDSWVQRVVRRALTARSTARTAWAVWEETGSYCRAFFSARGVPRSRCLWPRRPQPTPYVTFGLTASAHARLRQIAFMASPNARLLCLISRELQKKSAHKAFVPRQCVVL